MKKLTTALLLSGLISTPQMVLAEDAKPADAAPAADPAIYSIGGFDLTGHVDVGYTSLSGNGKFDSGVNNRVFDFERNKLKLHAVDLQFTKTPDAGFGGVIDATLGKDADIIGAYGLIVDNNFGTGFGKRNADLTQAYLHYGAAPLTIIAGKFVTLAGAEYIKSPLNTNYSRSILFGYAIPFTHTGVRATYKVSDELTVVGGINQGWDQFKDANSDKTIELQTAYTPSKTVALAATVYTGKENLSVYPPVNTDKGTRNLLDLLGTFNLNDQTTLVLNFDYGTQDSSGGKATWQGLAGYVNYTINDQWKLSFRAEMFDDKDGARTGIAHKWKEATLTAAYLPTKNWELRGEVRKDSSDKDAFVDSNGTNLKSSQNSFGIQALYKF
ncbi:MAG: outer membrane beta-barrel protein [Burkholderiales bacterium]